MSIIQDIREKYAKLTVVLIALALLGFILTDYFSGRGRGGFSGPGSVGSINGETIKDEDFRKKVSNFEANLRNQGGTYDQAVEMAWNNEIETTVLEQESSKLGISVGKKELNDLLYGANPSPIARQYLSSGGESYDPNQVLQTITQIRKGKDQATKNQLNDLLNYIALEKEKEKLTSLLANTVNFPRWFIEKINADNSQAANISLVRETYASVPDSTVKVEDKEIANYISKHKKDFRQEESRSISYVTFSAAPSADDSLGVRNYLTSLIPEYDTIKNVEQFLAREGTTNFYNGYINGNAIKIPVKDSIFRLPVGRIYGPYLDGNSYTLARLEGVRQMPDTVKVRHILIGLTQQDPQTGQTYQTRDTATAYKLADSIRLAIATGTSFDSLVVQFSDDGGSKNNGGVYENVTSGQMVPAFNDFIFLNPTGSKGIVKTDFGYHYIEVLSQKGNAPGYKISYLPKDIIASQETDALASDKAFTFAGESRDAKTFDETFEKKLQPEGLLKASANGIRPIDATIRGLGNSRSFVKKIYEAKAGEVLQPERIGDNYVVALVTEVFSEGTQSVALARPYVESVLRNKKKAVLLKQKAGAFSTLDAVAAAWGGKEIETVDSLRISSYNNRSLGYEPRVVGAAFNPANKGKVVPEVIEGNSGVYVIKVENTFTTPVTDGDVASQRQQRYAQAKQAVSTPPNDYSPNGLYPVEILKKTATVKDNRAKIY